MAKTQITIIDIAKKLNISFDGIACPEKIIPDISKKTVETKRTKSQRCTTSPTKWR